MGCGSSKRSKKRSQEIYSDPIDDPYSNSYPVGIISAQTEKRQLREMSLGEDLSKTQKHFCYICGNKILISDTFCANCGVKV
ncbi:MAG: hypothetical protein HeimC3_48850 [Candidatus Heimdallarchaeota archaeon LC_3]|nr:MAG: hypothetical protein HeimC3_48850 [Candidatus Heimdallarchaeota archaeon LC_3]